MTCGKYINHHTSYINRKNELNHSKLHNIIDIEISERSMQGLYFLENEFCIILGELVDQNNTQYILSKVDNDTMYIDEIRSNGFKVKNAKHELIMEYIFHSSISLQYKIKTLSGKKYGALTISGVNYEMYQNLKKTQYSTITYQSFLKSNNREEFFKFDSILKQTFSFSNDQLDSRNSNAINDKYIIENGTIFIILGEQSITSFGASCGVFGQQCSLIRSYSNTTFEIATYKGNSGSSTEFVLNLPIKISQQTKVINGTAYSCMTISNYLDLISLKIIKCTSRVIYNMYDDRYPEKFLENLRLFFTATNF